MAQAQEILESSFTAPGSALSDAPLALCVCCHRARDERGRWLPLQSVVGDARRRLVTHGLCLDCARRLYPDVADAL